jgi:hypothetical protein
MLEGANEQAAEEVPVLERGVLDWSAPAPAADEVDEPVDPFVTLAEIVGPTARRDGIEEVDDGRLDGRADIGSQHLERVRVAPRHREQRSRVREAAYDGRAEVPATAGHGEHTPVERPVHAATLATGPLLE